MRLLAWRTSKRRILRMVVILTLLTLFTYYLSPSLWIPLADNSSPNKNLVKHGHQSLSYYSINDLTPPRQNDNHHSRPSGTTQCTMSTCFNISRCLGRDFKVYVYSDHSHTTPPSPMYKRFLNAVKQSSYYTSQPDLACVFILNLDTLDRDNLSKEYVRQLSQKITNLPHWNQGRNHLIFNFFSGSYPDYSEQLDFPHGQAILAKASFSTKWYRRGFDISLPLLSKKHKDKGKVPGMLTRHRNLYPLHRRYLLTFKGKRYLWGHGSETRNSLHHLHNGKDIIMLTTCKHGKHWNLFMDRRCVRDNQLYDGYDFSEMIANSTFCLVPRGRRLGSFRFLEALQAGCIPVSLSNGFVLPFDEVIDWSKASLNFDERQLLQLPHVLRNFPDDDIFLKRIHSQFLWEEYFSSVEKVVMTTLEIIRGRIYRTHSQFTWNQPPGALAITNSYSPDLTYYPFYYQTNTTQQSYTAVILASNNAPKGDSPLVLLIKKICNAPNLAKVVILWIGRGIPKLMIPTLCSSPVTVLDKNKLNNQMLDEMLKAVQTEAILTLWEDTDLISDEAEFGFQTWLTSTDRLVGYSQYRHYWDPMDKQWKTSFSLNNQYSLVSLAAAFVHRYYFHYLTHNSNSMVLKIADSSLQCLDITINFIVSDITHKPPIKLTHRTKLTTTKTTTGAKSISKMYSNCLNSLYNVYGHMPLHYTMSRADPVLFNDNVSAIRKEFRKIEDRV